MPCVRDQQTQLIRVGEHGHAQKMLVLVVPERAQEDVAMPGRKPGRAVHPLHHEFRRGLEPFCANKEIHVFLSGGGLQSEKV